MASERPLDGERFWKRLRDAVAVAVVGGDEALHRLAIAALADGHALVEDVPGTGKTTLARAFARALGLSFARVQGTPDLLPGDVTGSSVYEAGTFRFVPGPVFANVLLVDEINRATPRTQSALLEAMQERQVSVDGVAHRLPDPFLVLATQNPIELEGTFSLPEAQLDRFLVRVGIGYPTEGAELRIAALYRDGAVPIDDVPTVFGPGEVVALRDAASRVRVSDDVHRYVVGLVRSSREHPDLRLGASPRASVALYRASQAAALLAGRDFVLPDDVAAAAPAVLAHRVLLDVDRELRGATAEQVVAAGLVILGAVAAAPGLVLLGVLALVTAWLSNLWSRRGLDRVRYERRLARDRAVWGDSVELTVTIENGKLLPLAWVRADDLATEEMVVRERPLIPSERPGYGILRNVWSLAPYEQVRRRVHLEAAHRGLYRFEWVRLAVADLFGRDVAASEARQPATFLVRPRTVPVRVASGAVVPLGTRRSRHGFTEDPSLFAGVRPFQPGDPRRRIHERATARVGRPVSKRFDPSTARQVLVALDVQTHDGPYWLLAYDEQLMESLAVSAGSLARRLLADGAACGLAVNGWTYSLARSGFVPPRAGHEQLTRLTDLLGRTSSIVSVPFSHLLAELPARLSPGTLVITVSGRDPASIVPALRRLRSGGFVIRHVALGPRGRAHAAAARRLGIDATHGLLDPDWRTSDALTLAG